jgi:hypothetical protein
VPTLKGQTRNDLDWIKQTAVLIAAIDKTPWRTPSLTALSGP